MKNGTRTNGPCSAKIGYTQIVSANLRGRVREITKLTTKYESRGQGFGTKLMHDICSEADKESMTLMLIADSKSLASWYSRLGFFAVQAEPLIMVRPPYDQ